MTAARRILHEKRRLIWPIVIALLINAGLYAVVVYPLSVKVAGGEAAAMDASTKLNNARREFAAARSTVSGKGQADKELEQFYDKVLPPDVSGARRITYLWIDQLATKCNLRLERQNSEPKPQRDSSLVKFTYMGTLSGEYRDIRKFIYELEKAPEFLVLENVELTQAEGEAKGVHVTVQIATYFRSSANGN